MTSRDFCFWLQGFFEINDAKPASHEATRFDYRQADMIRKHLALVFVHEIDSSMGPPAHQEALNALHTNPEEAQKMKALLAKLDEVQKTAEEAKADANKPKPYDPQNPVFRC